jgi:serine/threonine-protein kinase
VIPTKTLQWLAIGVCLAAVIAPAVIAPAWADWDECYLRCALYKEGQCVEHARSCIHHPGPSGGAGAASYGAIAFSSSTGRFGFSHHYANREAAEQEALDQCGRQGCAIATWFFNNCGALATSSNGPWGADRAASERRAEALAQSRCTQEGGTDCRIKVTHCSR